MDIRIGVTHSPREIELQLPDGVDRDELRSRIDSALGSSDGVLWVTDRKGREVGVAAERIAYVELGSATDPRPMGFSG